VNERLTKTHHEFTAQWRKVDDGSLEILATHITTKHFRHWIEMYYAVLTPLAISRVPNPRPNRIELLIGLIS